MTPPFLTFYTPTFRRPRQLAACLESVRTQSMAGRIEQIVIPDHVGLGVGGMFTRIREYADAVHGEYVHILADDDVLAGPDVVQQVYATARDHEWPAVILVSVDKGGHVWPVGTPWPPRLGSIDLGCVITRRDVWIANVQHYGDRYEGDYDFMHAVARAGHQAAACPVLFLRGAVSRGEAEAA